MPAKRMIGLCLMLLSLSLVPTSAKIAKLSVDQDSRRLFAIESFSFYAGGVHQMEVSNVGLKKPTENAGFLLMRQNQAALDVIDESSSDSSACLWKLRDAPHNKEQILASYPLQDGPMGPTTLKEDGECRVYFVNCRNSQNPVSFDVDLVQYNVDASGNRNYVSAGEEHLDMVFGFMSVLWLVCAVVWIKQVLGNRGYAKAIHHMMSALVCLKLLSVFFQAVKFHLMNTDGTAHAWANVYYAFTFMKGILMFTVILLIGTGWSLFKPFLTEKDKRIVAVVIPLQICTNVAYIYVDENMRGSPGWLTWRDLLHLLDIACCCAILFPIVWSIKQLREAAATDDQAQRDVERLRLFRQFYIMVVAYIYFTRIVVYLMGATLPYGSAWVDHLVYEFATLAFFCLTGYQFQPVADNPYFALATSEQEHGAGQSDVEQAPKGKTIPLNQVAIANEKSASV